MSDAVSVESPEVGLSAPEPLGTFQSFPISDEVKQAIAQLGYQRPTEVQAAVLSPALEARDLVVQSRTGSGKTSAFGIPLIERLPAGEGKAGEPMALILTPTRELAHQVATELRNLAVKKGTRVQAVYGGVPMGRQTAALRAGVDVVVGTPGRLLDHIRRRNLNLSGLKAVVLDEADEMLSMGFWDEVTELLGLSPKERQTMLFSATLPYEVAKAAAQYLRDPVRVDLSGDVLSVDGIENHIFHVLPDVPKPRQLMYVLELEQPESAIIFCNTRNETDVLAKYLTQQGFCAEALSGNLKQRDRERVMGRIKQRELRYMVATDIAARGIDINDLSHVVNYALPEFTEVFLHRVGRTGRIGKMGTAISLVDGNGLATLTRLEREFGIKFQEKALPPEEMVMRLRSERIMKELTDKAAVAEVGSHISVAQDLIKSPDGPQIVAFLLKQYFNNQAEGERRGGSPPASQRQPQGGGPSLAPSDGAADEGADGQNRRRRRRRRRGRGGDRPERGERSERGSDRGERGERSASTEGFETMDVHEALAGELSEKPAQPQRVAPEVMTAAQALAPQNGNGHGGNGHAQAVVEPDDGMTRIKINIGFDDGFKSKGAVAKKISALAGLNESSVVEVETKREYAIVKAVPEIAELLVDRVDGTPIGKKVLTLAVSK